MAQDRTSGFDMLVQISENELNEQLATAFVAGDIFPRSMSVDVNTGGVAGTAYLNFNTPPVVDLDRPPPQLGLTIHFANSQVDVDHPVEMTIDSLGGKITVVAKVVMITQGTDQLATIDFNAVAPDITVEFNEESEDELTPLLRAANLTISQAQELVANVVLTQLQTSIGRVDLTPPIPVTDDEDATTVFDIDVTTVNDTSALDRDCLTFGVRMVNDTGGNIDDVTSSMIPEGSQSLVMMSNFWLLAHVMRPRIADQLNRPVTDFDTPLRLNRDIPAPGGQGTLTNLEARVIDNQIKVTGRAIDSGTGWDAESSFSFFIDISIQDGAITATATTPDVDIDVDLAWWVWISSAAIGGLFGGFIGALVDTIVVVIVDAVAEGVLDGMISGGISSSLGELPSIPLGPIGGGLTLTSIVLDDLELRSTIVRTESIPIMNQGEHVSAAGFAMDLDSGVITADTRTGSDLVWRPSAGLSTNGSSGLTITRASFGELTLVQISRLPLAMNQIPVGLIPITVSPSAPFLPHNEVVLGLRTTEGRLAKVRAWMEAGSIHLDWMTFDTPTPSLDITARWSVAERGEESVINIPHIVDKRFTPVRRLGIFEARPRLVTFPIDYQWCLCGQVLEEDKGRVSTESGPLEYRLEGGRLYIKTEMEQAVDCKLCVSAIDARGLELYKCIRLKQSGTEVSGESHRPRQSRTRLELLEAEPQFATWRPLISNKTEKLINKRR